MKEEQFFPRNRTKLICLYDSLKKKKWLEEGMQKNMLIAIQCLTEILPGSDSYS